MREIQKGIAAVICTTLYTYVHTYIYEHTHMYTHVCLRKHTLGTFEKTNLNTYDYICIHLRVYAYSHGLCVNVHTTSHHLKGLKGVAFS